MVIPITGMIGSESLTASISIPELTNSSSLTVQSTISTGEFAIVLMLFGLIMLSLLNLFFKKI